MVWPAVMAGGSMVGSSLIGAHQAGKESDKAMGRAQTMRGYAMNELQGINPLQLPDLNYMPSEYGYYQGPSPIDYGQMQQVDPRTIALDPTTRDAQMRAMESLQDRAQEGLTAQDKYNFMVNQQRAGETAQGMRGAIEDKFARQGRGGSGLSAAMQQIASQGTTRDLALSQALQAASNADMRMKATQATGNMAGNIRGADYLQEATNTDILNNFAKWNSERERSIKNMNIKQQNEYMSNEAAEQRRISGLNTQQSNAAQLANKRYLIDKAREEQGSVADKHKLIAGAHLGALPGIYAQGAADSAAKQHMWGTIGQAGVTGANIWNDSRQKKDDSGNTFNYYGEQPENRRDYIGTVGSDGYLA